MSEEITESNDFSEESIHDHSLNATGEISKEEILPEQDKKHKLCTLNSQLKKILETLKMLSIICLVAGILIAFDPDTHTDHQRYGFIFLILGIIMIAGFFACLIFKPDVNGMLLEIEYILSQDFIVMGGGSSEMFLLCKKCNTKIGDNDHFIIKREFWIRCPGCGKGVMLHGVPWGFERLLQLMDKKVKEEK